MTAEQLAALLQDLGGYGALVAFYYFVHKPNNEERLRDRELLNTTLRNMPEQTMVIDKLAEKVEGLQDEVARRNQRSLSARS